MKFFNPKPSELAEVLNALEESAGYHFRERSLLLEALHHSSYAMEQIPPIPNNERLEFLGDAVLELTVSRMLFRRLPQEQEGRLTQIRSVLVDENANSANSIAIGLDRALFLGRGEELSGGRTRKSLLGDAFEALLGAIYLDGGFEEAAQLVERLWDKRGQELPLSPCVGNPKGELQEKCQALPRHLRPTYRQTEVTGPVHAPSYQYEVVIDNKCYGHGVGASKKLAENAAAADTLSHWEEVAAALTAPAPAPASSSSGAETGSEA